MFTLFNIWFIMIYMNNKIKNKIAILFSLAFGILFFIPAQTHATTGGPSFVHSFTYNPQDESVYFVQIDQSGRGCPPVLNKISLNTNLAETVYSCDQGEEFRQKNNNYDDELILNEIRKITSEFKDLSQINLSDNNISVDVNFSKDLYLEGDDDYLFKKEFIMGVYQKNDEQNTKVMQQNISGCSIKQPFIFAGYAIPGFEKKIIMLVSTVKDCIEGGYIGENLFVVGNVDNLDKNYTTNYYKGPSALIVSEATITVFESDEISENENTLVSGDGTEDRDNNGNSENDRNNSANKNEDALFSILTALGAIVIAVFVGWLMGRKK